MQKKPLKILTEENCASNIESQSLFEYMILTTQQAPAVCKSEHIIEVVLCNCRVTSATTTAAIAAAAAAAADA